MYVCILVAALLHTVVWCQAANPKLAESCADWRTKFAPQWLSDNAKPCREPEGSGTDYCCRLYLRLNGALRFFVISQPDGLGCAIREGEAIFFAKLYSKNCAKFAASLQPSCLSCATPSPSPQPTPSGSVVPSATPTPGRFIDIVPVIPAGTSTPATSTPTPSVNATTGDDGEPTIVIVPSVTPSDDNGDNGDGSAENSNGSDSGSDASADAASPTPSGGGGDGSVCFHRDGLVTLRSGGSVRLDALNVGDEVLVTAGIYSPVFMFTHASNELAHFVNITTDRGRFLIVTPGHLVHTNEGLSAVGDVRVGGFLVGHDGQFDRVASRIEFDSRGLYNPQTLQGDIVINGLKASTYTTHVSAQAAHPLLSIFRLFWRTGRWSTELLHCGVPSVSVLLGRGCLV